MNKDNKLGMGLSALLNTTNNNNKQDIQKINIASAMAGRRFNQRK